MKTAPEVQSLQAGQETQRSSDGGSAVRADVVAAVNKEGGGVPRNAPCVCGGGGGQCLDLRSAAIIFAGTPLD
jgi:hypothetical protein